MIKVIKENWDEHYLIKENLIQIKYCRESNMLIAYPINAQPEIKIDKIRSISDDAKIEEENFYQMSLHRNENYYGDSINRVLNLIKTKYNKPRLFSRIETGLGGVNTVDELITIGKDNLLRDYNHMGKECIDLISKALKDLYGIEKW